MLGHAVGGVAREGASTCEVLLHAGISLMSMTAGHALVHDSMSKCTCDRPTRLLLPQRPQAKKACSLSSLLSHWPASCASTCELYCVLLPVS